MKTAKLKSCFQHLRIIRKISKNYHVGNSNLHTFPVSWILTPFPFKIHVFAFSQDWAGLIFVSRLWSFPCSCTRCVSASFWRDCQCPSLKAPVDFYFPNLRGDFPRLEICPLNPDCGFVSLYRFETFLSFSSDFTHGIQASKSQNLPLSSEIRVYKSEKNSILHKRCPTLVKTFLWAKHILQKPPLPFFDMSWQNCIWKKSWPPSRRGRGQVEIEEKDKVVSKGVQFLFFVYFSLLKKKWRTSHQCLSQHFVFTLLSWG